MRSKIVKAQIVIYFICLIFFSQAIPALCDEPIHLVILHINDTHGHLLPFDTQKYKNIGGIARVGTLIKEAHKANKDYVLALHAGDDFSRGDDLTTCYSGEVNMMAMQAIGYDAFIPGNGDFYFGIKNLIKQTSLVKFPTLHANVFYKEDGRRVFQPYIIKEVGKIKIAILGLGFIREEHPSGRPLKLWDPISVAKEFVPALREKADLVIALTHIGLADDKRLAKEVSQIDIIVGGHSHSQIDVPLRIPRSDGNGEVIVAQAGDYGQFLGQLDVYLQSDGSGKYNLTKVEGKLIPIDGRIKEDEEVAEILKRYSEKLSDVVCISKVTLPNPESGRSPMGEFAAELIRIHTGTDVAILNRGAIQSEIKEGNVTVLDVSRIHPWHNCVLKLTLTSEQLLNVLAKNDTLASGCSYTKVNDKVENLKIGLTPVELGKSYSVAMDEYLYSTDSSLHKISFTETGETVDCILLNYLKQAGTIEKVNEY